MAKKLKRLTWETIPAWHGRTKADYEDKDFVFPEEVHPSNTFLITPEQTIQMAELLDDRDIVITSWSQGKPLTAYPSFIVYTMDDALDYHSALQQVAGEDGLKKVKKRKFAYLDC